MAVDWKKVGLHAATGGLAATPAIIKHSRDVKSGKKEGVFGYDASLDESRKEQRWQRKADRGSTKAASKLAEQRLAKEEAAATGKAEQEAITAAYTPYQQQLEAGQQAQLMTALEAKGGAMTPEATTAETVAALEEGTAEKMSSGYAKIKDVMDKAAALKLVNLRAQLFARGDAEAAAQTQMLAMISSMVGSGATELGEYLEDVG